MTPKGADLEATDLIEVSTLESGSYVTRSITGQELIDAIPLPPSGLTVGTTPIASGTIGRVLFQGTGNVLQQSSSLFWDSTNNRLGIGTSSPTNILTLGAAVAASLQSSAASIFTSNENASNVFVQVAASNDPVQRPVFAGTKARGTLLSPTAVQSGDAITTFLSQAFDGTAVQASAGLSFDAESNASSGNAPQLISFITGASGATRTTKMQVRSNGNVLINTTTDAGFRLDVNGTARVSDNTTITKTQDGITSLSLLNGSTGANASARVYLGNTNTQLAKLSSGYTSGSILKSGDFFMYNQTVGNITFWNNLSTGNINFTTGSASTPQLTLASTGNVLINTTTDAGFRLDVNGTARVQGNVTFGSTSTTGTATIQGSNIVELILSDTLNGRSVRLYKNAGSGYIIENNSGNQMSYGYASNYWMSWRNSTKSIAIASTGSEPTPDATSIFDLQSTTKGFLPPRMTTTQKNAIASPATGLQVYDTTLNRPCFYDGTTWITL
jgi:hypothetical protein